MFSAKSNFRKGFYAGLLLAVFLGLYFFQLWDAENQIDLHTRHLLIALEKNRWTQVGEFLDSAYADQWGNDRNTLLTRLQQVLPFAHHLQLHASEVQIEAHGAAGEWHARITLEADENEVSAIIREKVNSLEEPFTLQWQRGSWKPWNWKLVRVTNPAFEIPERAF